MLIKYTEPCSHARSQLYEVKLVKHYMHPGSVALQTSRVGGITDIQCGWYHRHPGWVVSQTSRVGGITDIQGGSHYRHPGWSGITDI